MIPERWQHQEKAIKYAPNYFGLYFDPGTGKTRTALELYNERHSGKMVIFAPLSVCKNWVDEINTYCKIKKTFLVLGSDQSTDKKIKTIQSFIEWKYAAILIMNIESLRNEKYLNPLFALKDPFVIADEFHNFKTHDSSQTEGFETFMKNVRPRFFYPLTGTPAPQGEIDLWSTFYFLRKTTAPFYVWRKKYFIDQNLDEAGAYLKKLHAFLMAEKQTAMPYGVWRNNTMKNARYNLRPIWEFLVFNKLCKTPYVEWFGDMIHRFKTPIKYVLRPEYKKHFEKLLTECTMSARKEEVMDLPPLIKTKCSHDLPSKVRKVYDSMHKNLFAEDEQGRTATARTILTRTLRLMQISAGILGGEISEDSRLKALDYAIDLCGKNQFLIWTVFAPTYDQLAKHLEKRGISYVFLTGRQSATERAENIRRIQAGEVQATIGHPKAGGIGTNITAASYMIYYTRSFNFVDYHQSQARNWRGGSERHERITEIDIIARDTVEENVDRVLKYKGSVQDFILNLKADFQKMAA